MEDKKHNRISGMPCPNCGGYIPISIHQIISSIAIYCPNCGLKLDINKEASDKALKTLKKIKDAENKEI